MSKLIANIAGFNQKMWGFQRESPETPPPPASPAPGAEGGVPTREGAETTVDEAARAQDERDKRARRRGRAATYLTGPEGAGTPNTATKTLLGE